MNARTPTTIDQDFDPSVNAGWTAFAPQSLREFGCVLAERMRQMATRGELRAVEQRLCGRIDDLDGPMDRIEIRMDRLEVRMAAVETSVSVLEERVSHTATKTWVLGGVVATLLAMVGAFWWIVQQYLAPLLRAAT